MVFDRAGNNLSNARSIALSPTVKTFRDRVGGEDSRDVYSFRLTNRSRLALTLENLQKNADLVLLDQNRRIIAQSAQPGTRREALQQSLEAGTYYLQVRPGRTNQETQYRLKVSASPEATFPPAPQPTATTNSFDIVFDYRFDTNGWFTPERRAALEAAAAVWEAIILDDFPTTPIGTETPLVEDPQRGGNANGGRPLRTDYPIDDVVIFVGARDLGLSGFGYAPTLAEAVPSGYYVNATPRYEGTDFEPWIGSIAFDLETGNSASPWFFDPTPATATDIPGDRYDFISTAVHEIGHVLGFGASEAFDDWLASSGGSAFSGPMAKAWNGGQPIPIDTGHIRSGYQFGGSGDPLMAPASRPGIRKLPTAIDLAILDDIGYGIDYSKAVQNPA